jgi:chitinase
VTIVHHQKVCILKKRRKSMKRTPIILVSLVLLLSLVMVAPVSAANRGAWAPNTAYAIGDTVTYNGLTYQCIQAHTSLTGWEPPNVPALWTPVSVTNTPVGATNTPTRTNTPVGPTATRTNTPVGPTATRTNTPVPPTATTGGSGCWPAWVSTTAYNGGAQVSRNGQNYQAAYWTQGDDPATHNGPAGSGAQWIPMGSCSGSSTATPTKTNTPTGPTNTPTRTPTSGPGGTISRVGMYYADWDIYARNYQPKQLETSGTAAKLTDIIFAFGNTAGGQCAVGDAYADYQKLYGAADSVSGVADTDTNNSGIIGQLRELKAKHPGLRIFWSFGGWTWSGGFTQAAANPTAFATSCWNLVNDARWTGVFDGIDLDWEYPNACGLSCDTSGPNAFKNLMAAMYNSSLRNGKMITAAITADDQAGGKIDLTDYAGAATYVNWYNVMTYDYFGTWSTTGPTAPHSPLNSYSGIPTAGWDTMDSLAYLRSKGVPASKLGFGIGFYGRGWTGVTQSAPGGSATGAAAGTYEAGNEDYKVLVNTCPATGTVGGTAYAYCGNNWWSYDTPSTIAGKMAAMKASGYVSGVFIWEANGDTTSGTLINAVYTNR